MSFWTQNRMPARSDYDTDEEYQAALDAYEDAEFLALEVQRERQYERQ